MAEGRHPRKPGMERRRLRRSPVSAAAGRVRTRGSRPPYILARVLIPGLHSLAMGRVGGVGPHRIAWVVALALLFLGTLAPLAAGKGIEFSLRADPASPRVGEQVTISLTGTKEEWVVGPCKRMRVDVIAPGVPVRRALRSLEGGVESKRIGTWGAFRLASLRSVGELRWTGKLRPNVAGRWTLIVPNFCARGYVLPEGVARLDLDVQPR